LDLVSFLQFCIARLRGSLRAERPDFIAWYIKTRVRSAAEGTTVESRKWLWSGGEYLVEIGYRLMGSLYTIQTGTKPKMSKAPDVKTYVAQVPADRRGAMERLRKLCRQNLTGYQECMEYGMPAYKRNGAVEVAFASQKQYIALYVLNKDVLGEYRDSLSASSIGKGCIRFKKPDQIDFEVLKKLLRRASRAKSSPC
jgi:uncharacterized protein YdhG (YjbR/CyaY superfamily)